MWTPRRPLLLKQKPSRQDLLWPVAASFPDVKVVQTDKSKHILCRHVEPFLRRRLQYEQAVEQADTDSRCGSSKLVLQCQIHSLMLYNIGMNTTHVTHLQIKYAYLITGGVSSVWSHHQQGGESNAGP